MPDPGPLVRVAAVGDLHCSKTSHGQFRPLFENCERFADVLVLCGDLTDYGLPEEAHILVEELSVARKVPIVAVLGNHDFESGREDEVRRILVDAGLILLDGDAVEIRGIGFAGTRGFAGGFGRGTLGSWGEKTVKAFVQEAVDEAMKLESALRGYAPRAESPCSTTHRSGRPSKTNHPRSGRSWAAADWKSH